MWKPVILLISVAFLVFLIICDVEQRKKLRPNAEVYRTKLVTIWDDVLRCKLNLADYCNGQMKEELHSQHKLHNQYMDRLTDFAKMVSSEHNGKIRALLEDVHQFIEYHQTTVVDICGFNSNCIDCLRDCVNLWSKRNSTCSSANAWKVVQYSPDKAN